MLPGMNEVIEPLPSATRWRPAMPSVICLLAGVMLTTALPPQQGTGVLAPLALAVLFDQLGRSRRPGQLAFLFGLGHAATLMTWLFFLDPAKSIPTRALVPIQAAAAILFVAAHYWLYGLVVAFLRRRLTPWRLLALQPVLWVALEMVRSTGELAFPWCLAGTAWLETPLRGLYATAGEIGLSAATALLAACLVSLAWLGRPELADRRLAVTLAVATGLAWSLLAVGSRPLGSDLPPGARTEALQVACVQADVKQADKWHKARIDSTRIPYTNLTARAAEAGAELVVWAETAVPAYVRYDRELLDWVRTVARGNGVPILAGFPDARRVPDPDDPDRVEVQKFNAAGLFSRMGTLTETYGKHHLVPLGEAMPFQRYLPFLGNIDVGQAEWTPGAPPGPMVLDTARGEVPLTCLICFEGAFSRLARGAVAQGAVVLVNITNDGWFGYSAGPRQHAALARIRAIECGVPLVRCANNGISLITDARGQLLDHLALGERGLVAAAISPVPLGTLYVRWGLWPVLIFLTAWTLAVVTLIRRRTGP
jgi:apolipoprotein N-acyltransferase